MWFGGGGLLCLPCWLYCIWISVTHVLPAGMADRQPARATRELALSTLIPPRLKFCKFTGLRLCRGRAHTFYGSSLSFTLDVPRIKLHSIMCLKPLSPVFSVDLRRSPCKRGLFIMSAGQRWRQGCLCGTLEKLVESKRNKQKLRHSHAVLGWPYKAF